MGGVGYGGGGDIPVGRDIPYERFEGEKGKRVKAGAGRSDCFRALAV